MREKRVQCERSGCEEDGTEPVWFTGPVERLWYCPDDAEWAREERGGARENVSGDAVAAALEAEANALVGAPPEAVYAVLTTASGVPTASGVFSSRDDAEAHADGMRDARVQEVPLDPGSTPATGPPPRDERTEDSSNWLDWSGCSGVESVTIEYTLDREPEVTIEGDDA